MRASKPHRNGLKRCSRLHRNRRQRYCCWGSVVAMPALLWKTCTLWCRNDRKNEWTSYWVSMKWSRAARNATACWQSHACVSKVAHLFITPKPFLYCRLCWWRSLNACTALRTDISNCFDAAARKTAIHEYKSLTSPSKFAVGCGVYPICWKAITAVTGISPCTLQSVVDAPKKRCLSCRCFHGGCVCI